VVQKEYNAPLADIAGSRDNGGGFESGFVYPASHEPRLYWREAEAQGCCKTLFGAREGRWYKPISVLVEQIPVFIPLSVILKAGVVKYRIR
jgi:hypothetical protein